MIDSIFKDFNESFNLMSKSFDNVLKEHSKVLENTKRLLEINKCKFSNLEFKPIGNSEIFSYYCNNIPDNFTLFDLEIYIEKLINKRINNDTLNSYIINLNNKDIIKWNIKDMIYKTKSLKIDYNKELESIKMYHDNIEITFEITFKQQDYE